MKNSKFIIDIIVLLAIVSDDGDSLATDKDLSKSFSLNSTSLKNSHEELHSKIDSATSLHPNNSVNAVNLLPKQLSSNTSVSHQIDSKILTKPDVHIDSTPTTTSTSKHNNVIGAEGGVEVSSQYPLKSKANETIKNITLVNTVTPHPSSTSKIFDSHVNLTTPGFNSTQIHKRIHGRPGVSEIVTPSTTTNKSSNTTTITPRPRKKKPLFTMITGDKETKQSESFIESPTTGRDYVLPIVLIILSLPIVVFLIKIIYRRGTEFTERQQYHRMYLIDGMYNSR